MEHLSHYLCIVASRAGSISVAEVTSGLLEMLPTEGLKITWTVPSRCGQKAMSVMHLHPKKIPEGLGDIQQNKFSYCMISKILKAVGGWFVVWKGEWLRLVAHI